MIISHKKIIIIIILIIIITITYYIIHYNIYKSASIINKFFDCFCSDLAVFNPADFEWTSNFRSNWTRIRDEYIYYTNSHTIPLHLEINASVAVGTAGWQTLYLRAYGIDTVVSKNFPLTMSLINQCECTLAFFSVVAPRTKIRPHVGVYKGVIRYHLGLIVPDDRTNCFIRVDANTLYWTAGSDIMFDDMFMHHVENNTDQSRVVLFLDIKRDFHNIFINGLNSLFLRFVKSNDALADTISNVNQHHLRQ